MRKTGQTYECMGEKEKVYLRENLAEIKRLNKRNEYLFEHKLDTAGWHRRENNKEIKRLRRVNADLRKGFIKL